MKIRTILLTAVAVLASTAALAQPVNRVPALGITDSAGVNYVNSEGQKATYFAALGGNTPAATPTDIAILTGSSTKTIRVTRVLLTVQATAAGLVQFDLVKRIGGTQSAVNTAFAANTHAGLMDSADAASSVITAGLAGIYTANPASVGTLSGIYDSRTVTVLANGLNQLEWKFCDRGGRSLPGAARRDAGDGDFRRRPHAARGREVRRGLRMDGGLT
jgi:hypothetical protein